MIFANVGSEVKAVPSVVAWPRELEHQQQLLLGPLLMSEGDPAVLFSSALGGVCVCVCVCVSHSVVLVTQLCPTLCDPMDCSLPGSSVHGILQARILEYIYSNPGNTGFLFPSPWIFPMQGSNLGLLHCRQIFYCLSHQGSSLQNALIWLKMPWFGLISQVDLIH